MQREAPLTPKSRRINRPAAGTPDRTHNALADSSMVQRARAHGHRATIAPGDFAMPAPGLFGRKRLPSNCRQSIVPISQATSSLDVTRRPEADNKDLEMKLLLDKILQTTMVESLMKKKADDNDKTMITQLGTMAKEDDALEEKSCSMKAKESDVGSLVEMQESLDTNLAEITAVIEEFEKKPVKIILQLQTMLRSLDSLKCKNIIIPETPEQMERIDGLLAKCSNILRSINDSVGSKRVAICTVNEKLTNFSKTHADIQDYAMKAQEAMCGLQVALLKDAARSVSRNEL